MGVSREVQLHEGERFELGPYALTFVKAESVAEPHRSAIVARVAVTRNGRELGEMTPRMNQYESQREPIGTPAVRTFLTEDLYLSVMNIDAERGNLGLLAMINPMVGWIWIATGVMALGGVIALAPRRSALAVKPGAVTVPVAPGVAAEGSR
jgi:cytochrome c-type biogenesis protein CcmF